MCVCVCIYVVCEIVHMSSLQVLFHLCPRFVSLYFTVYALVGYEAAPFLGTEGL